jgi:hypothetical protein
MEAYSKPSLEIVLFHWKLRKRIGAMLVDVEVPNRCFRGGNLSDLEHARFGKGTVIGERASALCVRYQDGCRMFRQSSQVVELRELNGEPLWVEPKNLGALELGCLVAHKAKGIGGNVRGQIHHRWREMRGRRSGRKFDYRAINFLTKADVAGSACESFGLLPCGVVRYAGKVAMCLGIGELEGTSSVFFETEQMVKRGLGIGCSLLDHSLTRWNFWRGFLHQSLSDGRENCDERQHSGFLSVCSTASRCPGTRESAVHVTKYRVSIV